MPDFEKMLSQLIADTIKCFNANLLGYVPEGTRGYRELMEWWEQLTADLEFLMNFSYLATHKKVINNPDAKDVLEFRWKRWDEIKAKYEK